MKTFNFTDTEIPRYGDRIPLNEFLEYRESGGIMPQDGTLGEVLVDGRTTDINVPGWGWGDWLAGEQTSNWSLNELDQIEGEVDIMWYNK